MANSLLSHMYLNFFNDTIVFVSYLIWLSIFVWFPTLLLWIFNFKLLWKYKITLLHIIFFSLIITVPWDLLAVKTHIWIFPKGTNLGIFVGELPLEEYFFFIFVPLL